MIGIQLQSLTKVGLGFTWIFQREKYLRETDVISGIARITSLSLLCEIPGERSLSPP
jgi:hypothetical protein